MQNKNFRTALFVAWRHLFSKKKHSLVNIIAIISAIGVLSGTAALIIVLSVFNGMEELVVDSFNSFNPDLKITLREGKSFATDSFPLSQLQEIQGISAVEEVVSDLTLIEYDGKQHLIELKGVGPDYARNSGFDELLIDGDFDLQHDGCEFGVMGAIAAGTLQVNLSGAELYKVFYPKRLRKNLGNPADAFNKRTRPVSGVFSTNTAYDEQYVFCPIDFARELMRYEGEVTSMEVLLNGSKDYRAVQQSLEKLLGNRFIVKNQYQQEALLFKTMKSEKLIIFFIVILLP